jgi:hypothetical protein
LANEHIMVLMRHPATIAAAVSLVILTACTASSGAKSSGSTAAAPTLASPTLMPGEGDCPSDLSDVHTSDVPGMNDVLVPGHPDSFGWCESGNAAGRAIDQAATKRVQNVVNALPLLMAGNAYGCNQSRGPAYGVFFHYPDGDVLLIRYSFGPACPLVTNGHRTAHMNDAVHTVITRSIGRG